MEKNKSLIGFCLSVNDGLPKSCDSPFVSHCWDLPQSNAFPHLFCTKDLPFVKKYSSASNGKW